MKRAIRRLAWAAGAGTGLVLAGYGLGFADRFGEQEHAAQEAEAIDCRTQAWPYIAEACLDEPTARRGSVRHLSIVTGD